MEQTQQSAGRARLAILWRLSWPAIIEQILATMVSYVDTAMVGVMGAAGTAAVSVNAAPIWLCNGLLTGVGVGYSVQVSNAIWRSSMSRCGKPSARACWLRWSPV